MQGEWEMVRNCKEQGHDLEPYMTIAGYQCKGCKYYIRAESISGYSWGRCPKCDAPKDKLKASFLYYDKVKYDCQNCGHSWQELG